MKTYEENHIQFTNLIYKNLRFYKLFVNCCDFEKKNCFFTLNIFIKESYIESYIKISRILTRQIHFYMDIHILKFVF